MRNEEGRGTLRSGRDWGAAFGDTVEREAKVTKGDREQGPTGSQEIPAKASPPRFCSVLQCKSISMFRTSSSVSELRACMGRPLQTPQAPVV